MRADRLLSIVLLLETQGRMTAQALAHRLEVSPRTIQRDMEALSAAGIPVVADRGTDGGWYLLESYRTNLTGLNMPEIMTLFLNKPSRLLEDLGVQTASKAALLKLLAALPEFNRPYAEWIQQSFYLDTSGWSSPDEDVSFLPSLQEAICEQYRLELNYFYNDVECIQCEINPLGLVAKGNIWYLVGETNHSWQTYRVSCIHSIRMTEDVFDRPPDFDLEIYWEQSGKFVTDVPAYLAVVRVTSEAFARMNVGGRYMGIEAVDQPDADGWRTLSLLFESQEDACEFALSLGARLQVIDPPTLREMVFRCAQGVVALYANMEKEHPLTQNA